MAGEANIEHPAIIFFILDNSLSIVLFIFLVLNKILHYQLYEFEFKI